MENEKLILTKEYSFIKKKLEACETIIGIYKKRLQELENERISLLKILEKIQQ